MCQLLDLWSVKGDVSTGLFMVFDGRCINFNSREDD